MKRENCINRNITIASAIISGVNILTFYNAFYKHRLTRAHREKQLKMSCQALHNAPPNRT